MDRALEAFEQGERARIAGDDEAAIDYYREALTLCEDSSQLEAWRVQHMLGVSLTSAEQYSLAQTYFAEARLHAPNSAMGAICRNHARCLLLQGNAFSALGKINESLEYIPIEHLSERGASNGFLARIQIARGHTYLALQYFGLADSLLQRGDNRYYELYNLLHFIEALIDAGESTYAISMFDRVQSLIKEYGNKKHQDTFDHLMNLATMEYAIEQVATE